MKLELLNLPSWLKNRLRQARVENLLDLCKWEDATGARSMPSSVVSQRLKALNTVRSDGVAAGGIGPEGWRILFDAVLLYAFDDETKAAATPDETTLQVLLALIHGRGGHIDDAGRAVQEARELVKALRAETDIATHNAEITGLSG